MAKKLDQRNRRGQRRVAAMAEELRKRITSGQYLPLHFLPTERSLAEEFRASCRTVSAALDVLARDGLVRQQRGRGTQVVPPTQHLRRGGIAVVHARWSSGVTDEAELILRGVQDTFAHFGCRFERVPFTTPNDVALMPNVPVVRLDDLPRYLERYDAFLFVEAEIVKQTVIALEQRRVPVVVANLEGNLDVTATKVNHRKVTQFAVSLLAALGHRRIALLARGPEHYFYGEAIAGYREGLAAAGLACDEALIAARSPMSVLDGYLVTQALLGRADPPTAVVACRDYMAAGACRAVTERGLSLGRDVSVIGFDDIGWRSGAPGITTFREPCYALGAEAARLLYDRMINGWRPPQRVEMDAELVVRRSVGPCPGADAHDDTDRHVVARPVWGEVPAPPMQETSDPAAAVRREPAAVKAR